MNSCEGSNDGSPVNLSPADKPPSPSNLHSTESLSPAKSLSPSNLNSPATCASPTDYSLLLNLSPEQCATHPLLNLSGSPHFLEITSPHHSPPCGGVLSNFSSPERDLSPQERLYHAMLSPLFGLASFSTEDIVGGGSPSTNRGDSPQAGANQSPSTPLAARYTMEDSPPTSLPARYIRVPRGHRIDFSPKVLLEVLSCTGSPYSASSVLPWTKLNASTYLKEDESAPSPNTEGSSSNVEANGFPAQIEEDASQSVERTGNLKTHASSSETNGLNAEAEADNSCANVEVAFREKTDGSPPLREKTDDSPPLKKRRKYKPRKHIPKTLNLRGRPRKVPVCVTKLSFDPIHDFMGTLYPHQLALNNYNPMDIPEYRELMEARDLEQCFHLSFGDL